MAKVELRFECRTWNSNLESHLFYTYRCGPRICWLWTKEVFPYMKYDLIHNRMKYFLKEYSNFHAPLFLQGISSIFTIVGENAGAWMFFLEYSLQKIFNPIVLFLWGWITFQAFKLEHSMMKSSKRGLWPWSLMTLQ